MRLLPARWRFPAIALFVLALGALSMGVGALTEPAAHAGEVAAVYPPFWGQVSANRFSANHSGNWGNPIDMWQYDAGEPVTFRATHNVGLVYVEVGRSCEGGNVVTVHMWDHWNRAIGKVEYRHIWSDVAPGWYRPLPYYGFSVLRVGRVVTGAPKSSNCWTGPHAHVAANGWPQDYGVGAALNARNALYLWSI